MLDSFYPRACLEALQNVCLNLSFEKDFHMAGKKMTKNGRKMAIYES